mmetsp:Transcript_44043/g.80484  ORF Transcript_44043/g.80484 Transcript_44043/m.80484 type:complete len:165 (+) Transcript_44043:47-541(+)
MARQRLGSLLTGDPGHTLVDTAAWPACVLPAFTPRQQHAAFLVSAGDRSVSDAADESDSLLSQAMPSRPGYRRRPSRSSFAQVIYALPPPTPMPAFTVSTGIDPYTTLPTVVQKLSPPQVIVTDSDSSGGDKVVYLDNPRTDTKRVMYVEPPKDRMIMVEVPGS